MTASRKDTTRYIARIQPLRLRRVLLAFTALLPQFLGCAACHPIKGVPARQVPEEYLAEPRSGRKTIDLSLLRQAPPDQHYVDGGDVLAVYIEGVLGRREDVPPVHFPENGETRPSLGYPIPVRGDGTISVPMVPPISVRGMTISQVEVAIRRAYTVDRNILEQGRDRIFVALQRPREYRVLVIRQEEGNLSAGGQGLNLGSLKRGSGDVVRLPAYRNDVLNALAETNGLPGLDAENAIYVIRRRKTNHGQPTPSLQPGLPVLPGGPGAPPEQNHLPHDSGFPALQPPGPGYSAADSPNQIVQVSGIQAWPGSPADVNSASDNVASDNTAIGGPETHTAVAAWDHSPQYQQVAQVSPGAAPAGWGHSPAPDAMQAAPPAFQQQQNSSWQQPVPPAYLPADRAMPPVQQMHAAQPSWPGPAPQQLPQQYQQMPPQQQYPPQYPMPAQQPDAGQQFPQGGNPHGFTVMPAYQPGMQHGAAPATDPTVDGSHIIRIPVRLAPGEIPQFTEQDILLEDGDIVFIESRDAEVFYTGGLLASGQFTLPRDYDLDILGAIAIAEGQRQSNGKSLSGGNSAMNQDVTISASQAIIVRRLPNGQQFPIHVDLYRTLRHPEERILVQPGDYIVLQYTRVEAFAAFLERHLLEGALFSVAASRFNGNGGN